MQLDFYTKLLLTVIALCLAALTWRSVAAVSPVAAQGYISCQGELKANSHGGTAAAVGGYKLQVTCR
jgi:hypothetical protein